MADMVHDKSQRPSGRKQWTLHDGPRSSLHRLRNQLAEDGCSESQLVLAKRLLEETNTDLAVSKEENDRLAVYWLIKASEQGNLEATNILRRCLETGQGITEMNFLDVKTCLAMTQEEKLVRKAARDMFTILSDGQGFITTNQLNRCLNNPTTISRNPELEGPTTNGEQIDNEIKDWEQERPGEKITEDQLVSAADDYLRGILPLDIQTTVSRFNYYSPFEYLADAWTPLLDSVGPWLLSNSQILALILVYSIVGAENIFLLIPTLIYYSSYIIMVISTFRMLCNHRDFRQFRHWSRLFIAYTGGTMSGQDQEYAFCQNHLKPYAHFFVALLTNLIVYPTIASQWTPQSEMAVLAIGLTLSTLYAFMDPKRTPDTLVLLSFGVHVLAKYPYESDAVVAQGWRFLDIRAPTFASFVVGNGVEFCLNFRAVFYLVIPGVFVRMAARDGWRGIYTTLFPHCVTLSWWQLAVLASQGSTWYGLVRSTLAVVGLVLFLPLAGVATLILPVLAALRQLATSPTAITIALMLAPFALAWYSKQRSSRGHNPTWVDIIIRILQITLSIFALGLLLHPYIGELMRSEDDNLRSSDSNEAPYLTWDQYHAHCHEPVWEEHSEAYVHSRCTHLAGIPVSWQGYVTHVKVVKVDNPIEAFVNKLPASFANTLTCQLGRKYDTNCRKEDYTNDLDIKICKLVTELKASRIPCHLNDWSKYTFEIGVRMKGGLWDNQPIILLHADNSFKNITLRLRPGDRIWFSGTLSQELQGNYLLGDKTAPMITLDELGCLICHTSDIRSVKRPNRNAIRDTLNLTISGLKFLLNFVFNPIIIFK